MSNPHLGLGDEPMGLRRSRAVALGMLVVLAAVAGASADEPPPGMIDLTGAEVGHTFPMDRPVSASIRLLVEEVRARGAWRDEAVVAGFPGGAGWKVVVGQAGDVARYGPLVGEVVTRPLAEAPPAVAEGYAIVCDRARKLVAVVGHDDGGALFGAGRLLRELRIADGRVRLPEGFTVRSAPKQKLRGHQLGYRPKTNSYDAWDRAQWERYIRELAVFGANAVELVPPRTDDDAESPHFPERPLDMMEHMARVCDDLGQAVWVWFPVMDPVDTDPSRVEPLLKEWDEVFRRLPRLDAVFVPGGDPGHIPPKPLFAFLEKAAAVMHRSHPGAALWVSPQGFDAARMGEFLTLVGEGPKWLDGVVFGPQVRVPLSELRKSLPSRLPIRGYPDITHSRQCQHPVPDWDLAFACTEGREAINPRPRAEAALVRAYRGDTVGFITYSEGCNDDVNKAVWSALGWDPDADVVDVLRQYGRFFLGDDVAEPFAQGLLALERNWSGPLLTNGGVETALRQFQDLERDATPKLRANWRFQQALYRAYYDAYVRDRLVQETALEHEARQALRQAPRVGAAAAVRRASEVLDRSLTEPASPDRRARVFELGEALFQSVRMQLSKPKYQAIDPERGASLDTIDTPLNDRVWLGRQFTGILGLASDTERRAALDALLNRTDPGPGGFYDAPGDPNDAPHLVREPTPGADPMFVRAPFHGFALRDDWPAAWRRYAQTFHDAPLRLAYDGLDPRARYRVRVVYAGDSPRALMRLDADGSVVHGLIPKPDPVRPVEFSVPTEATADGRLTLTWHQNPGRGGNGRGCQVAEVWLIREPGGSR